MFQFLTFANEASAVEDDHQRADCVHRGGPNRWNFAERGKRHPADDE
jgi:hypothetical protein